MGNVGRGSDWAGHDLSSPAASGSRALKVHLHRYWALWVALAIVAVAGSIGLYTGVERLIGRWAYLYSHSYLVLGMSAWLLVLALRQPRPPGIGPSPLGFVAVAGVILLYALSELVDFTLGMQVALPLILLAAVAALAGLRFARVVLTAIGMLYFTIPVWDLTVGPLQSITVSAVTSALRWTGRVAYIQGSVITIPAGVFEIAEGCSGMRYFMVSLALAAFYGFCCYRRWRTRVLLLAVAGLVSMISNWIRIYTLILIGDATEMRHYLIVESHDGYGWLVYVVCMAPVLWFARWLEVREPAPAPPSNEPRPERRVASPASFLVYGSLVAAVVASPAMIRGGGELVPETTGAPLALDASAWRPVPPADDWQPEFRAPYRSERLGFVAPSGARVDIYIARYLSQRPDSKLIADKNDLSPGWQTLSSRGTDVQFEATTRRVEATELGIRGERRLLWHWFLVGGRPTHDRARTKLLEVLALFSGRRDGAVIAVSSSCAVSCAEAEAAMSDFVADAGPLLEAIADGRAD